MQLVETFLNQNAKILANKTVVVAASGGPDSLALLDLICHVQAKLHLTVICAHFDHQLRPGSQQEARLLRQYCKNAGVEFVNAEWQHQKITRGIEAKARTARYEFLRTVSANYKADLVLTAHHGDDLLENELLKLIRSGDPFEMNSLQELGVVNGVQVFRPLLQFSKQDLLNYVQNQGLDYIIDQTNLSDQTLRNRIRHQLIPQLKQENPHVVTNAYRFAQKMTRQAQLQAQVYSQLPVKLLFKQVLVTKIQAKDYYEWLIWQHFGSRVHLNEQLTAGPFRVFEYRQQAFIYQDDQPSETVIALEQPFMWNQRKFIVTYAQKRELHLLGTISGSGKGLVARMLKEGDRFILGNKHVKPRKVFADRGIEKHVRKFALSICNESQVCFCEQVYCDGGSAYVYEY